MRALRAAGAVVAALALLPPAAASEPDAPSMTARIRVGTATGEQANPSLGGVSWNTGSLDGVAPLDPSTVRIDASLQDISLGPHDPTRVRPSDLDAWEALIADVVAGLAAAFPDPAFIVPYADAVRAEGLPLDFVSWHYYGNYPFFGDNGADFYRAASEPDAPVGDWGLVRTDGTVKPAWWALHAWKQSQGRRLAVTGDAAPAGP